MTYYALPFCAGKRLGLARVYPRVHYTAHVDWDKCTRCGLCIGRSPFDAFYHDDTKIRTHGEVIRHIVFDPELCWGCGLCASACPEKAVKMQAL